MGYSDQVRYGTNNIGALSSAELPWRSQCERRIVNELAKTGRESWTNSSFDPQYMS